MLVALFSDLHRHNYRSYSRDGGNDRLSVTEKVVDAIYSYCDKNGINRIGFAGDWYNQQGSIPTAVTNASIKHVRMLDSMYPEITIDAISGNHDYASKNLLHKPAVTALSHLHEVSRNFTLIDNEYTEIGPNVYLWGIPYYEFAEHFQAKLKEISEHAIKIKKEGDYFILMIHQTPRSNENKMIPHDTDPEDPLYRIFDQVACGHIHHAQQVTPTFTLLANPCHRDIDDVGEEKGFWVFDTDKDTKEFISLKGVYPEIRIVNLKPGELLPDDDFNYLVPFRSSSIELTLGDPDNPTGGQLETFDISRRPTELLEAYCNEVKKGDEELLTIGLECLQSIAVVV